MEQGLLEEFRKLPRLCPKRRRSSALRQERVFLTFRKRTALDAEVKKTLVLVPAVAVSSASENNDYSKEEQEEELLPVEEDDNDTQKEQDVTNVSSASAVLVLEEDNSKTAARRTSDQVYDRIKDQQAENVTNLVVEEKDLPSRSLWAIFCDAWPVLLSKYINMVVLMMVFPRVPRDVRPYVEIDGGTTGPDTSNREAADQHAAQFSQQLIVTVAGADVFGRVLSALMQMAVEACCKKARSGRRTSASRSCKAGPPTPSSPAEETEKESNKSASASPASSTAPSLCFKLCLFMAAIVRGVLFIPILLELKRDSAGRWKYKYPPTQSQGTGVVPTPPNTTPPTTATTSPPTSPTISPPPRPSLLDNSDITKYVTLAVFGTCGGALTSLTMMTVGKTVTRKSEKTLVGTMLSAAVVLGLCTGSALSLIDF
ncbi:unnamed protein product [Amoebophrya sp. A25]|nr:unnamed protein product [Amoebophrya sp. A25]|eukprot:GSA25T00024220001.1